MNTIKIFSIRLHLTTSHFGKGFYWKSRLNPEFKENMEDYTHTIDSVKGKLFGASFY